MLYVRAAVWTPPRFPDFMCIGAPRAATSWLYTALRDHPRVFLPKRKELHFYDEPPPSGYLSGDIRWADAHHFDVERPSHLRWYWRQFRQAGDRLTGDITPLYSLLSAERIAVIRRHQPALRIIYLLRNPVERAWSGLRKSAWYQKGPDFLAEQGEKWMLEHVMHPSVLERGNYPAAIERWESVFPAEQILYSFHEDIRADADRELSRVTQHLGLPDEPLLDRGHERREVNAAPPMSIPDAARQALEAHYRDQVEWLEQKFSRDLSHWLTSPEIAPVGA
jgi:hypothetical protein